MLFEPALAIRSSDSSGEFIDFRVRLKFSRVPTNEVELGSLFIRSLDLFCYFFASSVASRSIAGAKK